jgi:hypothetical protein
LLLLRYASGRVLLTLVGVGRVRVEEGSTPLLQPVVMIIRVWVFDIYRILDPMGMGIDTIFYLWLTPVSNLN